MNKIRKQLKTVKINELGNIIKFFLAFPVTILMYPFLKQKNIWLVMENINSACDNGYHFYNYVSQTNKGKDTYYAIDKKSNDYQKLKNKKNVIQACSIKHFIYFNLARFNISTQKNGNPCNSIYYLLNKLGFKKNSRIFLQHGITMNKVDYINYKNAGFRLFVCAATPEYQYIKENFGYPEENVQYLGFSRFDHLIETKGNKKQIVIMPTWRNYLQQEKNFTETTYYKTYNSLINNQKLLNFIEQKDITIYFYPHKNMQKYIGLFQVSSPNIQLMTTKTKDIQELLKESSLMITDYSSVSIDFAYMKKPLIYYQFDQEEFQKHLQKGYFSYEKDGFGPVEKEEEKVVEKLIQYVNADYEQEEKYQKRTANFFKYHDKNNSKRIYEYLKKIE